MPTPAWRLLTALFIALPMAAHAQSLPPGDVPAPLRAWIPWALHGHADCPTMVGGELRACGWPAQLDLVLDATSGRFTQRVQAYAPTWLRLPGDATRWPQDVKVDGRPAVVLARDGVPSVKLEKGDHVVSGTFAFEALPESLTIPPQLGLLTLTVNGKAVARPGRDASGLLWLQREAKADDSEARLDVTVHRLVSDEVPLLVTTRVRLDVSGTSREVLLGRALLPGFAPLSLSSPLPARLDPDGKLRVQVRPGTWTIDVAARHEGPVETITLGPADGPWAATEVWAFDARPELRLVETEGVAAVDPLQTTLPDEWRHLPAFHIEPGDTLKLVEKRRGDATPAADRLSLHRKLWLSFDGTVFTAKDQIDGTLSQSWRLSMPAPSELGRVEVAGRDQIVTRVGTDDPPGVEVRNGELSMTAESRIPRAGAIPAVGWDADFLAVNGSLTLPPGWRLLHAGGVDEAPSTWLQRWTLLDLFLVLITTVVAGRLFGPMAGGLAFFAMALSITEPGAPRWFWLTPLALEALARVVGGRMGTVLRTGRTSAWVVLALMLVPFAATQLRAGMYPSLERDLGLLSPGHSLFDASTAVTARANYSAEEKSAPSLSRGEATTKKSARKLQSLDEYAASAGSDAYVQRLDAVQIDPKSSAQTGHGVPEWSWREVSLRWSGPVERHQQLSFVLLPPWGNLVATFLRVGLLALLFGLLVRRARTGPEPAAPTPTAAATVALLLLLPASPAHAETLPSEAMLAELRNRLTATPDCDPTCASMPRMSVEIDGATLRLRLEVLAASQTAVPLAGDLEGWQPQRVYLDGRPAPALRRGEQGTLWLAVEAGAHQVVLEGALPVRDTVQVPLPMRPQRVEPGRTPGWELAGVRDNGTAEGSLQFTRQRSDRDTTGLENEGAIPAFFRVERALLLGLEWSIETRVTRLTPDAQPVLLEVPLVEGESVISAEVRVANDKALVHLPARVSHMTWRSVLARRKDLTLTAPTNVPWVEVWRLEATPVWHVERSGLPAVHTEPGPGARIPEWRPWPGETLALRIEAPQPVPGPTMTVQSSTLLVRPGLRTTDATLTLNLSASRGGQHTVTLPDDAALQSLAVDGRTLPARKDATRVTFPVKPGKQEVTLTWRESKGIVSALRTPEVDLGVPSANARLTLELPRDRWLLWVAGPDLGPAVLFWSLLIVIIVVAAGLGRVRLTPLRTRHWLLLALGLTQVPILASGFVAGWLLLLGLRQVRGEGIRSAVVSNLMQLALVGTTLIALGILVFSIQHGLLGEPDMHVQGNNSWSYTLHWYQDRAQQTLPTGFALSVPLLVFRLLMLAWALWLAFALVGWLRWGFAALTTGGGWRALPKRVPPLPVRRPRVEPPPTPQG